MLFFRFDASPKKLFVSYMMFCLFASMRSYLKSDSHLPKKMRVIYVIESPLKMMKNAF